MRKALLLVTGLIVTSIGISQEIPTRLSLQEAIDYALQNNRTAINAERDITAAEKQKWETIATGLPQISAGINYQNAIKQQVTPVDINGDGIDEDFVLGDPQNVTAIATLNQKIFDGSYIVGLQSAKVFLEISKNAKVKTDLEVRKSVIEAYGNVLLAEESIEILNKNIAVLQKNLDETTKIFENGLEEEESVEQLKITLSGVESQLNNTSRLKSLAYQMLNITIGLDLNSPIVLTDNCLLYTSPSPRDRG